jgi:hypothetical protein
VRRVAITCWLWILVGCVSDLRDPAVFEDPEAPCDFDVQEDLLLPRCAGELGCHVAAQPMASLEYVSEGLPERLLDVPATTCPSMMRINVCAPDESFLLIRTQEDPRCGTMSVDRMPLARPPLSEREALCLSRWVHAIAAEAAVGRDCPP